MSPTTLGDVHALIFDVFGTVVDWHGSIVRELELLGKKYGAGHQFAITWRNGYTDHIHKISQSGSGSLNADVMHHLQQILEKMLQSSEWKAFGEFLSKDERDKLNSAWHRLDGWPDATASLYALKKHVIVAALSNGNVRLLVDMAKHAELPWDVVFSSELFMSFKPDPNVYLGAMKHLSLKPENCAMVATHVWDLRGAARAGMKTIYVGRAAEKQEHEAEPKIKAEGGEVDAIIGSFTELVSLFSKQK
ncbi:HAD-like domain-containing protein [Mycena rebaudengoi]|nr:HAD-like domain-containing protein [Mycena rebaudengoi]